MAWYSTLLKIFSGTAGSVIDSVTNAVDKFVTTDEEKAKLKMELEKLIIEQQKIAFEFQKQMEELTQKREEEIEKSIRAELEAKAGIMIAELKQDDKYTKRARPTVIYAGLLIIFLEMFGLRYLILDAMGFENFNVILENSKSIFERTMEVLPAFINIQSKNSYKEKLGSMKELTLFCNYNPLYQEVLSTLKEQIMPLFLERDKVKATVFTWEDYKDWMEKSLE